LEISSKSHLTLSSNILKWPQLYSNRFLEQAKHIRGSWKNYIFSLQPLHSLLAVLKNILELEDGTNKNQEFSHGEPIESDEDRKKF
jgi:hypothetical protein